MESQTTLKKRLQNRNLQDTKSVMEEKIKPEAGDTGEEAKVPGESGTPKEGPAEEPAEEPVVRKSARARIQELVKQREEAIRLAQKPTNLDLLKKRVWKKEKEAKRNSLTGKLSEK